MSDRNCKDQDEIKKPLKKIRNLLDKEEEEIRIILEEAIEEGKTLAHVALRLDNSPGTIKRWAAKYDLTFKNKSPWRIKD